MRLWLLLLFCGLVCRGLAQDKTSHPQDGQVEGIVFDKDTKDRVARTNIINTTTGKSFYNNLKGEFKIDANTGDQLVFLREDYLADTVIVKGNANLAVSLKRLAIPLREVTIRDSLFNPLVRLRATRKEFSKAYGPDAYNDILSVSPGGGAGISVDALWNALSKSGRNAEHLQGIIQTDYQQNVIDYRFNRSFVGNITKLKDKELTDFMIRFRPSYYTVNADTEYEFITYIRNSLRRYLRNKKAYALPPLNAAKSQRPE
ncbi:MAG: hypothetical protein ACXVB0_05740 [Mucilaginibacter sp.]